ncbi:MAG: hypothetical protein JNM70_20005 [Anaerolineae bacterium]|nr:hypothetical protein [Anaerolineae bacterium]
MTIKKRRYTVLVLVALSLIGCAVSFWFWRESGRHIPMAIQPTAQFLLEHPEPRPEFLVGMDPPPQKTLESNEQICVCVWPGAFMRAEDIYQSAKDHVVWNTRFVVNGRTLMSIGEVGFDFPAGMIQIINGEMTGAVRFCFLPDVGVGLSIAEVITTDMSGTEHRYRWVFFKEE